MNLNQLTANDYWGIISVLAIPLGFFLEYASQNREWDFRAKVMFAISLLLLFGGGVFLFAGLGGVLVLGVVR